MTFDSCSYGVWDFSISRIHFHGWNLICIKEIKLRFKCILYISPKYRFAFYFSSMVWRDDVIYCSNVWQFTSIWGPWERGSSDPRFVWPSLERTWPIQPWLPSTFYLSVQNTVLEFGSVCVQNTRVPQGRVGELKERFSAMGRLPFIPFIVIFFNA